MKKIQIKEKVRAYCPLMSQEGDACHRVKVYKTLLLLCDLS